MEQYIEYLRKSQFDRDFAELSLEETLKRHRERLDEFTKRYKINVTVVLEEVVSGESLTSRPMMMKCLELVNTGEYAGVVCTDIDRLSRGDSMDSGYIMQVLKINNCKIVTPDKTYDLENDSDEQFTDMKFMFSRYELKTITKRLVGGRDKSASEGKYLGSAPPYGYEIYKLPDTKGNSLKIIPDEAEVVKIIFDMYVNQQKGYNTIAAELNNLGFTTKTNIAWSQSSVVHVITNPVYIGKIRWRYMKQNKTFEDGKLVKKKRRYYEYEVYDGLHEPIISEELFKRAEEMRNTKYIPPVSKEKTIQSPFAEILYCANCGEIIKRKIPSQKQFEEHNTRPWYRCKGKCGGRIINCDRLDVAVAAEMRKWLHDYTIKIEEPEQSNHVETALDLIQKQITSLQEQQDKICNLLETGVYTIELFTKRNSALDAELKELKAKQEKLQQEVKDEVKKSNLIPMTQQLLDSYDLLTPAEKNKIWKLLLEKVTCYRKPGAGRDDFEVHLYPKIPTK